MKTIKNFINTVNRLFGKQKSTETNVENVLLQDLKNKDVKVEVNGDFNNLLFKGNFEHCNFTIVVQGNVGTLNVGSGDVQIFGIVLGDVTNGSGDISVSHEIQGDVQTGSGDVNVVGTINGSVKTGSGNIKVK